MKRAIGYMLYWLCASLFFVLVMPFGLLAVPLHEAMKFAEELQGKKP